MKQLLQHRLKTNIVGGTGHVQPRGSYVKNFIPIALGGQTFSMTVGTNNNEFGYTISTGTWPAGDLDPKVTEEGHTIYSIHALLSGQVRLRFGVDGNERIQGVVQIILRFEGHPDDVIYDWNINQSRYQGTDATLGTYLQSILGNTITIEDVTNN